MSAPASFHESNFESTPIRDLGLTIAGTPLEPILHELESELARAGIRKVRPRFYLSTEWGVPFDTVALAIPFYLAKPELTALQADRAGFVEGTSRSDILRYLRHEMGHVINYAYQLYEQEEWVRLFGSINRPYEEEYVPRPFHPDYVVHLPGWYAQKHPDEDWAETFAIWMTPGRDWRKEYAYSPQALAKLEYCDRTMKELADREPLITDDELDEDVGELNYTLAHHYREPPELTGELPVGLDGSLRAIFEDPGEGRDDAPRRPASELIRRIERELVADVYRWTGYFPERSRRLVRHLAARADQLEQRYAVNCAVENAVAFTTLVTALAMNFIHRGNHLP